MIYIKELANGDRIAQIFQRDKGYCVELFQKLANIGRINFSDEKAAENYAENWIQDK
jgi:hypothetical protein